MKMHYCVLLALALALLTSPAGAAVVYFQDNFDSYATQEDFVAYSGWVSNHVDGYTPYTTPPGGGCYEIPNPPNGAVQYGTTDWCVDTFYTQRVMTSIGPPPVYTIVTTYNTALNPPQRDGQPTTGNQLNSSGDFGPSADVPDSGASHDAYTPAFATGDNPWLHVSINYVENNNNGKSVAIIDASADGGATWDTLWLRSSPGRNTTAGDGSPANSTPITCTKYLSNHANAGGFYGVLDLDLSAYANKAAVQLRFRQYEPNDDWIFTIDDVVVDDTAGPQKGPYTKFAENFSNGGTPTMGAMVTWGGAWNNSPGTAFQPELQPADDHINRVGHPAAAPTPGTQPLFAVTVGAVDAWMATPVLDLSDLTKVTLAFDDECRGSRYATSFLRELLLMADTDGVAGPSAGDTVLKQIFQYDNPDAWQCGKNENAYYAERAFAVSEAAGRSDVYFAWHSDRGSFWAVDNISVSGVPEPSTIALLVGAALMGLVAYRRRG